MENQGASFLIAVDAKTGVNRWRQFDRWPPADLQQKSLYVHGRGRLRFEPPADEDDAHDDYVSDPCDCNGFLQRKDTRASLGTALTYKFNREFSLKGEYRYDQLQSNSPRANYNASVFLVGLKLQR